MNDEEFEERDSMNVDTMNDEGFGDWRERERDLERQIQRGGSLEDLGKNNRPWQVYIN